MTAPTSFDGMPTLASDTRSASSPSFHRRRKSWVRRVERCCCTGLSYFPLVFVYGLTSWAVWVEVGVSFLSTSLGAPAVASWYNYATAGIGILFYALANTSYTVAVFTDPGSPLNGWNTGITGRRKFPGGYERVGGEDYEDDDEFGAPEPPPGMSTVTAKSDGKPRFCKKCRCVKPDRTHHCSTCGRCVLKMDHHCPWLATCVGLRNYKAFLLFLIYTSLFCWVCFATSAKWVWAEIVDDTHVQEGLKVVNIILLAVLGGIIGLVLSGFTGWHLYLAVTGQTTIESLEKTRYLSPLRKSMETHPARHYLHSEAPGQQQSIGDQLKEIHANALPGILRPEEGESGRSTPLPPQPAARATPATQSLQRNFASLEQDRERQRYESYLDEVDSEKLPNAFDMGWRRNLVHLFGEKPLLWPLPVCNTSGDGWHWDVSSRWTEARDDMAKQRERRRQEEAVWSQHGSNLDHPSERRFEPPLSRRSDWKWQPGHGFVDQNPGTVDMRMDNSIDGRDVQMQPMGRAKDSDDSGSNVDGGQRKNDSGSMGSTRDWNDVPDDFLEPRRIVGSSGQRSRSRGRRKGD